MMLPLTPPSPPMPEPRTPMPAGAVTTQEGASPHPDYDLHPLLVRGLEHYLSERDTENRFHIR